MAPRSSSQSASKGRVWTGVLLMLFLVCISVLSVNIASKSVSFVFLPLIGVCLWPRTENSIGSIIAIVVFGLLLDLISAGPLGLWSLVFLSVFTIFQPHSRLKEHNFSTALRLWVLVLLLAIIASFFLGWFALESRPDIVAVLLQALLASLLFPLIYGLRHLGKHMLSGSEMRGF